MSRLVQIGKLRLRPAHELQPPRPPEPDPLHHRYMEIAVRAIEEAHAYGLRVARITSLLPPSVCDVLTAYGYHVEWYHPYRTLGNGEHQISW